MSYINSNDGSRIYVKDWGEGDAVVMAHGWPLSADSFDDLSLAIANSGRRAISYDRRGFGRSDQPWTGYDYDTLADDMACVIEQTGAKNVSLLGFSMGGGEVARYLTRHDGRNVRHAILISAVVPYLMQTPNNPNGVDPSVFATMLQGIGDDRAQFFSKFFDDFFGIGLLSHPVSDEVVVWAQAVAMQAGLRPTLACAQAFSNTDLRRDMASFKVPTLIIHGAADKTVPIDVSARLSAQSIGHATLIEYEGAPHGLFASHKRQLANDVLAFLDGDMTLQTATADVDEHVTNESELEQQQQPI
jgi:non-heme chloroperoxidase